ncbi:hypothetical protein HG536_0G04700 [Torulaspora globosa]|uniref:Methyltransferase type 11 domain-containing protein n=1 Tax=Torulaspora globosa TaxID=48254 RepID=A0A7G3ZM72_9SACH|nr:uncharacterized protein HG536_0G04700 [Torulaspora globosa]QLL34608.1 hypothetical protein HG536_0G04700 [Torulaspora globosa]
MAEPDHSTYKQGYSTHTVANHQRRTAEDDAAFVLPHINRRSVLLDVGCGPGTITSGFAKYAPEGAVIGVDISADVLEKARGLAADAGIPASGPGSVTFELGNVLDTLPYPDNTFDVVFCSQVLGHFPSADQVVRALTEMRRVLKPGGLLAAREAAFQHFSPQGLDLDRLWTQNLGRALRGPQGGSTESIGAGLPALFRRAGFTDDGGKMVVGAGTSVIAGREARGWIARRAAGQLQPGDPFRQSWLRAGITQQEIQETLRAVETWAETEDAWFVALQCEMRAWKVALD